MSNSLHLTPLHADGPLAVTLRRCGGRLFRIDDGPMRGDRLVTLEDAPGPLSVIVPRGLGRALLARGAGPWRAEGSGERCLPSRWVGVGGVAAWIREVERPRGPRKALPPAIRPDGPHELWIAVKPHEAAWAAARRAEPAAGHGAVVLADRRVRAMSPGARACGIVRGMSVSLAKRRCHGLTVLPPRDPAPLLDALHALLDAEVGAPVRVRGGWACPIPRLGSAASMQLAERVAERIWQSLGLEVSVAVGPSPESAYTVARAVGSGQVAVITASAGDAWRGGARRCAPPRYPDVEGLVSEARGLAACARSEAVALRLVGDTTSVPLVVPPGRASLADRVEAAVRRQVREAPGARRVVLTARPVSTTPLQLSLAVGAR